MLILGHKNVVCRQHFKKILQLSANLVISITLCTSIFYDYFSWWIVSQIGWRHAVCSAVMMSERVALTASESQLKILAWFGLLVKCQCSHVVSPQMERAMRRFLAILAAVVLLPTIASANLRLQTTDPSVIEQYNDRFSTAGNKAFIGEGYDWSGVGQDIRSGLPTHWAVMISPSYFL